MIRQEKHHIEILLIENIKHNIDVIRQMLNNTNAKYKLIIAKSKAEVFEVLREKENLNLKTEPDLILLNDNPEEDIDMNFIQKISGSDVSLNIPVLSLKITDDIIEIVKVIDNNIDYQSTKMIDIEYFIETITSLKEAMDSLVKLTEFVD